MVSAAITISATVTHIIILRLHKYLNFNFLSFVFNESNIIIKQTYSFYYNFAHLLFYNPMNLPKHFLSISNQINKSYCSS